MPTVASGSIAPFLTILNLKRMNYEKPIRFKHTISFSYLRSHPALGQPAVEAFLMHISPPQLFRLTDRRRYSGLELFQLQRSVGGRLTRFKKSRNVKTNQNASNFILRSLKNLFLHLRRSSFDANI